MKQSDLLFFIKDRSIFVKIQRNTFRSIKDVSLDISE